MKQPKEKHQSRLSGAVVLMIAQAIVLLLGYMTHLWIGRVLGPGPYGIYGVVLSVQVVLGIFLTLGIPSAVSRFVAQNESQAQSILHQALRLQLFIAIALGTGTALLSPLIARLLNDPSLQKIIAFVGIVVFSQAFYPIFVQYFSGLHRFNRQALLTSIYAIAKLGGAITLLYFWGVFGALAGFAIGGFIAAVLGWVWTHRRQERRPSSQKTISLRSFLTFAGTYVIVLAGLQLLMSIDLFMVKALIQDDVQTGYYNAAVTLSRISYFLLQGLSFIILPSVSLLTKPGASATEAASFIRQALRYLIALIVPSITIAAATSKGLIQLFFSSTFSPGAAPLTILLVGLGALAFYLLLANIAAGAGRPHIALLITIIMIVISISCGYFLIPAFGLIGAAWQTTIASGIGLVALATYIFSAFKIPYPVKSTLNILLATVVAVAPTYIWKVSPIVLPLQYAALFGIYIAMLSILREVTAQDRKYIATLHPKLAFLQARHGKT